MLLLTGKIGKAFGIHNFFVYVTNEFPATYSNLEPGAQPKLAHAYDGNMLWRLWLEESDCCRKFWEGTCLEWIGQGGMKWGWVHPFLSPPPLSSIRFFPLSLHPIFRKRAWSQVMSLSCGIWLVGEVLWGIPWCTSKLQSTVPKPINFQPLWYNVGGLFWSHIGLKSSMLCALLFGMVHGFEKKLIFFS